MVVRSERFLCRECGQEVMLDLSEDVQVSNPNCFTCRVCNGNKSMLDNMSKEDIAEPAVAVAADERIQVAEPQEAPSRSSYVKVGVECKKCGRKFEIDFFPFAPHPILVGIGGAENLKPYLREMLIEEYGPFPDLIPCKPPSSVPSCSACARREPMPKEGDTFKKRGYRGKFKTMGRERTSSVPEIGPNSTYDRVDQKLTVYHLSSRYGREMDDANKQSAIRERLLEPEQLKRANEVLEGMSTRAIEQRWGIPRMTASRGKKAIQALASPDEDVGGE